MRQPCKGLVPYVLALAFIAPIFVSGCAVHARVYGPGEDVYYSRWEHETHRDHMAYEQRRADEQRDYWRWRDHHPDQH